MTQQWQPYPTSGVPVPQTVGLSTEVAFNLVRQSGLAPMFQPVYAEGQPMPGVATQWGQAPLSFSGQATAGSQTPTHVTAQNPPAGTIVQPGSAVYLQWADAPTQTPKKGVSPGVIAGIIAAVVVLLGIALFAWSNMGGSKPAPSGSVVPITPTVTATATATATATEPGPTRTVTKSPKPPPTATVTETATPTPTLTAPSGLDREGLPDPGSIGTP